MYQPVYPQNSAAIEQLIASLRMEIEGLKSTVDFLSGISERATEGTAQHGDRLIQLADMQRMLIEKVRELGENQQIIGEWLAHLHQNNAAVQQTTFIPQPSLAPSTLPPVNGAAQSSAVEH